MGRKRAREGAMCLIYKMEMNQEFSQNMIDLFFTSFEYDESEKNYILDAAEKIKANLEFIDDCIEKNLNRWRIDRLAKIDLSVLRIAVYEIFYRQDIPVEVSVNEAIEIVKKYSSEDAYKFINGVLGGVISDFEDQEQEGE